MVNRRKFLAGLGVAVGLLLAGPAIRSAPFRAAPSPLVRDNVLPRADGETLEEWGRLYRVARVPGESDESLRARLVDRIGNLGRPGGHTYLDRPAGAL